MRVRGRERERDRERASEREKGRESARASCPVSTHTHTHTHTHIRTHTHMLSMLAGALLHFVFDELSSFSVSPISCEVQARFSVSISDIKSEKYDSYPGTLTWKYILAQQFHGVFRLRVRCGHVFLCRCLRKGRQTVCMCMCVCVYVCVCGCVCVCAP